MSQTTLVKSLLCENPRTLVDCDMLLRINHPVSDLTNSAREKHPQTQICEEIFVFLVLISIR